MGDVGTVITVETIDPAINKIFLAGIYLQGVVRSRRCVKGRAFKEAREETCMRGGVRPSTLHKPHKS